MFTGKISIWLLKRYNELMIWWITLKMDFQEGYRKHCNGDS